MVTSRELDEDSVAYKGPRPPERADSSARYADGGITAKLWLGVSGGDGLFWTPRRARGSWGPDWWPPVGEEARYPGSARSGPRAWRRGPAAIGATLSTRASRTRRDQAAGNPAQYSRSWPCDDDVAHSADPRTMQARLSRAFPCQLVGARCGSRSRDKRPARVKQRPRGQSSPTASWHSTTGPSQSGSGTSTGG